MTQVTTMEISSIVDILGNLGAIGVVLWLFVRTTNHTIPRLAASFEQSLRDARMDFGKMLDESRKDSAKMLEQQRLDFHTAILKQQEFFEAHRQQNCQHVDMLFAALKESTGSSRPPTPNNHNGGL